MKIDDLMLDVVDRNKVDDYWNDLRRLVQLEGQGKTRPPFPVLMSYFKEEYGVNVGVTTLKGDYAKVKNDAQDRSVGGEGAAGAGAGNVQKGRRRRQTKS